MRLQVILLLLILNGFHLSAQEKNQNTSKYQQLPDSFSDREKLLLKILEQKKLDYWEFWFVDWKNQDVYPLDDSSQIGKISYTRKVLVNGGVNQTKANSQLINLINPSAGFWNIPPGGDTYNLVYVKNNRTVSITSEDSLVEFLKPIKSIEQAVLYANLKGYHLSDVKSRNSGLGFFELKMISGDPIKEIPKRKGAVWIYSYYYLKISEVGEIYKKKIGERKYRIQGVAIP